LFLYNKEKEREMKCPKDGKTPDLKKCRKCTYVCEIVSEKDILVGVICKPPLPKRSLEIPNPKRKGYEDEKLYKSPLVILGKI